MSDSMNPVFKKNDIIIIQEQNEYKVGDIVAYIADDGNIVTHRIIEKNENGFYTKGDNNNTKDKTLIHSNSIIGKFKTILYLLMLLLFLDCFQLLKLVLQFL